MLWENWVLIKPEKVHSHLPLTRVTNLSNLWWETGPKKKKGQKYCKTSPNFQQPRLKNTRRGKKNIRVFFFLGGVMRKAAENHRCKDSENLLTHSCLKHGRPSWHRLTRAFGVLWIFGAAYLWAAALYLKRCSAWQTRAESCLKPTGTSCSSETRSCRFRSRSRPSDERNICVEPLQTCFFSLFGEVVLCFSHVFFKPRSKLRLERPSGNDGSQHSYFSWII